MEPLELDPRGDVLLILHCPNTQSLGGESFCIRPTPEKGDHDNKVDPAADEAEKQNNTTEGIGSPPHDSQENGPPREVRYRVSSSHLRLASDFFSKLLDGPWQEGVAEECLMPDGSKCKLLRTTEWDTSVFLILLNIIHGHFRQVPRSVDLDTLGKFSVLVDYYKCHEITELFTAIWTAGLTSTLPASYSQGCIVWLFISWVFGDSEIFKKMTELIMQEGINSIDETESFPFPAALISTIEDKRTHALYSILGAMSDLRDDLREEVKGCNSACSSMLLGSLMKQMAKNGLDGSPSSKPLQGLNLKKVKSTVLGFQSPEWFGMSNDEKHPCTLRRLLRPPINKIWTSLEGLNPEDYPAHAAR